MERRRTRTELREPEALREKYLSLLESEGLLRREGEFFVADLEKFRNLRFPKMAEHAARYLKEGKVVLGNANTANRHDLIAALEGLRVVSVEDFEAAREAGEEPVVRQLIYRPQTLSDAFDAAAIRASTSYLDPWEIGKGTPWSEKVVFGDGSEAGLDEVALAKILYGKFAAAREEDGVLRVTDPETGKRITPGSEFLRRNGLRFQANLDGKTGFFDSPVKYLLKNAPHVVEKGLLLPSDFKALSSARIEGSGDLYRQRVSIKAGARLNIGGAGYILGSLLDPRRDPTISERFFAVPLEPGVVGIIEKRPDGVEEVRYTFRQKSTEEIEERRAELEERARRGEIKGSISAHIVFGKKDGIVLEPYRITKENKPLPGESVAAYAERVREAASFGALERFSKDLSLRSGIGVHSELSLREQQWLGTVAGTLQGTQENIVQNARKFGISFLRTFLSAEYGTHFGESVLMIAEKFPPEAARKIFSKYSEIVAATHQVEEFIASSTRTTQPKTTPLIEAVTETLLRRGKDLVAEMADEDVAEIDERIAALEVLKGDILLFAATFKNLAQEQRGAVDFAELAETSVNVIRPSDISDDLKHEMVDIFKGTHAGGYLSKERADREREEFEGYLHPDSEGEFEILQYKSHVVAFLRLLRKEDGVLKAGSLNVRKGAEGSSIGTAMIEGSISHLAEKGEIVEAEVYARNPIIARYVETIGFMLDGFDPDFQDSGEPLFTMRLDTKLRGSLPSAEMTDREILAASREYHLGDEKGMEQFLRDAEEEIVRGGKIISHYRKLGSGVVSVLFEAAPQKKQTA